MYSKPGPQICSVGFLEVLTVAVLLLSVASSISGQTARGKKPQ